MNRHVEFRRDLEAWLRGNAYLPGITRLSGRYPDMKFATLISILDYNRGGWSEATLKKAWLDGRA